MSKRVAGAHSGAELRYGQYGEQRPEDPVDVPQKATAAQMAKRKIAQSHKKPGRRSESPAFTNGTNGQPTFNSFSAFSTPSTNSFQFGATSQSFGQTSQPDNSGSAAPVGQFGTYQTQQNGSTLFDKVTPGSFYPQPPTSQNTGMASGLNPPNGTSSFFGQLQTPQQNGNTPAANPGNPFAGYGQSTGGTAQKETPSGFIFGARPAGQSEEPSTSVTTSFGQTSSKHDSKPLFASASSQTPKPSSSTLFATATPAAQPSIGTGLFGAPLFQGSYQTSVPGVKSIFADLPKTNTPSNNGEPYFKRATPAPEATQPSGSNLFAEPGQLPQPDGDTTPRPTNIFGNLNQTQNSEKPAQSNLFSGLGQMANGNKLQTPSSNLFGNLGATPATEQKLPAFGAAPSENTATGGKALTGAGIQSNATRPLFQFTSSPQDISMTTPDSTPQQPLDAPATERTNAGVPSSVAQESAASQTQPPTNPSLMDRIRASNQSKTGGPQNNTKADSQPAKPSSPSTSSRQPMVGATAPSAGLFGATAPTSVNETTVSGTETPLILPSTGLFGQGAKSSSSRPLFGSGASAPTSTAITAPSPSLLKAPVVSQVLPRSSTTPAADSAHAATNSLSIAAQLRNLNSGLLSILQAQKPEEDWWSIWQSALVASAQITGRPMPSTAQDVVAEPLAQAPSSQKHALEDGDYGVQPEKRQRTTSKGELSSQPRAAARRDGGRSDVNSTTTPNTSNSQKKLPLEGSEGGNSPVSPVTEKRSRTAGYAHHLNSPEDSSQTSKLFQSMLGQSRHSAASDASDKNSSSSPRPTPLSGATGETLSGGLFRSGSSLFKPGPSDNKLASTPLKVKAAPGSSSLEPSSAGKLNGETASSGGPAKPYSGFMPTASSGGPISRTSTAGLGGAMAAFGSRAQQQSSRDREKRKAEDYDSDEDDAAAWEAEYARDQAAKREQIVEAAQAATGFVLKPSTAHQSSSNLFGTLQPKISDAVTSGGPSAEAAERAQGAGDNTWKPDSPLKFGTGNTSGSSITAASTGGKTTGLFGAPLAPSTFTGFSSSGSAPEAPGKKDAKLWWPKLTEASRGTSPSVTTDGDAPAATDGEDKADDEPSDSPKDQPSDDAADLQPAELKGNEILFQLPEGVKALCKRMEQNKTDNAMTWATKGTGRLFVIKNIDTGKARVIFKQMPLGQLHMNFEPVKGVQYSVHPQKPVAVTGAFMDHIGAADGEAKLTSFWMQLKTPDLAQQFQKVLVENTAQ